MKEGRDA